MKNIFTVVSSALIGLIISGCNGISTPDDYFKGELAQASGCNQAKIVVESERYVHPSSIWTISCDDKKYDCYQQSYGFKQVSGYVDRKMYCDLI